MTTYTIMTGDTMWNIAAKHGIELKELLAANPQITNSSLISPGQTINIPSTNTSTYTVTSGDTMWNIAAKHGIGLKELLAANPQVINSSLISPGQIINIPSVTNVPSTPNVSNDMRSLEIEVIRLVNIERAKVGRSALIENNKISNIARIKSQDFIKNNYFSHNSPTYGSPFDMLKSFGITYTAAGENIANGQRTAAEVMNSWMNSSGHRANILNSAYNQIGVGVAKNKNGNLFWTQMLVRG